MWFWIFFFIEYKLITVEHHRFIVSFNTLIQPLVSTHFSTLYKGSSAHGRAGVSSIKPTPSDVQIIKTECQLADRTFTPAHNCCKQHNNIMKKVEQKLEENMNCAISRLLVLFFTTSCTMEQCLYKRML